MFSRNGVSESGPERCRIIKLQRGLFPADDSSREKLVRSTCSERLHM